MALPAAAIVTSQLRPAILAAERVRVMPFGSARGTRLPADVLLSRGVSKFDRNDACRFILYS
jgi:hypothetical protein